MNRDAVFTRRRAGILLHPTSLPGPGYQGTLGDAAHDFLNVLTEAGVTVWQTLPLLPVNETGSPYQPLSLFAGNPTLVDAAMATRDAGLPVAAPGPLSDPVLAELITRLRHDACPLSGAYQRFREQHRHWLLTWCEYRALRRRFSDAPWPAWPPGFRPDSDWPPAPLDESLQQSMEAEAVRQFFFHHQWHRLRVAAGKRGIALFGDLPFYPAAESADVWFHPDYFHLDSTGRPLRIAGAPPDAFSDQGQSWGTPTYDWDQLQEDGFDWWMKRLDRQLELFDILRLDHFRGLDACWWHGPDQPPSAGQWESVPGDALLTRVQDQLGDLPLVAEDLGHITESVHRLRERHGLYGMRVLQFGFAGDRHNPHHPDRVEKDCVLYPGTHDNDTLRGWWSGLDIATSRQVVQTLDERHPEERHIGIHWRLIRLCLESRARLCIIPIQDLLGLGSDARMNTPGTQSGNWQWRLSADQDLRTPARRLRTLLEISGRAARPAGSNHRLRRHPISNG